MSAQNFRQSLAAIFRPPFAGLWFVMLAYYIWAFVVYPNAAIWRGDLPDTDDYMYLNQLLDWLVGQDGHRQGWYDNLQHRLDPGPLGSGAGVPIHFSRLTQLPMSLFWGLLRLCGLGAKGAATLMAMFYPVILLGVFFNAMRWVVRVAVPNDWAGASAYIVIFTTGTLFLFQPGHIDHHALVITLLALTLGSVGRMFLEPHRMGWSLLAGSLLALDLTVALEVLPWLLILSSVVGLWAVITGGNAARQGLLYALALHLGSIIGLLVTRPLSELFVFDVLTYSSVYVLLTCGVAVAFAGLALVSRFGWVARLAAGGILGGLAGFFFLQRFPDLAGGPYGGIDPALAQIILGEINEAQPLKTQINSWWSVVHRCTGATIALISAAFFLRRAILARTMPQIWIWALQLCMLAAAFYLTVFYQRRFIGVMGMLTILPLTMLLAEGWCVIGVTLRGRKQTLAEIGLLVLVGPLTALLIPALIDGRSFNTGMMLYPAYSSGAEGAACNMYDLEQVLRDPRGLGSRPRLIMNTISTGPELLFRTPHRVLAAPYHMDVAGNVDATRFFSTPYPEEAEGIARRRHIDLVVACRFIPESYLRRRPTRMLRPDENYKDFAPHFVERLMDGQVPDWLVRVKTPTLKNFVIYQVKSDVAATPTH